MYERRLVISHDQVASILIILVKTIVAWALAIIGPAVDVQKYTFHMGGGLNKKQTGVFQYTFLCS